MGGSAFKEQGLYTPRMSPAVYRFALKHVEDKLSIIFQKVAHCIEGPEKQDYGDLDVLVLPDPSKPVPSLDERCFYIRYPWPAEHSLPSPKVADPSISTTTPDSIPPTETQPTNLYIQLDLQICTSPQDFTWRLFIHAHGDLINILSSTLRHKGLTINDQALYLRIPTIETHNKKLARVELTRDPPRVLTYLGLSPTLFHQPFPSLNSMMSYIATSRFHNPAHVNSTDVTPLTREETTTATLNTYDNYRLTCRPQFKYWYHTYLPSHTGDPPGPSAHLTREEVREDAFTFFGPALKDKYTKQESNVTNTIQRNALWSDIRAALLKINPNLSEQDLHDTLRALKREILPPPSPSTSPTNNTHLTPLQTLYTTNAFPAVISHATTYHAASLSRYRAHLADTKTNTPLDHRKTNPFSTSEVEIYTADDDDVIVAMKNGGATGGGRYWVFWGRRVGVSCRGGGKSCRAEGRKKSEEQKKRERVDLGGVLVDT
ncbi:hypothetical protein PMZ80_004380 [Knufia obscura]|uniref:Uncharacterized protein n=1 Tax=Knufia obscura TaxID=1635080 RepID=A0ABR0RSY0_9EURO|nr:hypothetical protein PMZ80_004380 [Knufia obscura]